jgi:hypothetical protein
MNMTAPVQRRGVEPQALLHRAYPYNRNKNPEMQTIFLSKATCMHSISQLNAYIFPVLISDIAKGTGPDIGTPSYFSDVSAPRLDDGCMHLA